MYQFEITSNHKSYEQFEKQRKVTCDIPYLFDSFVENFTEKGGNIVSNEMTGKK